MKRYIVITVTGILLVVVSGQGVRADIVQEIVQAAEDGLPAFLDRIPSGMQEWYGFENYDILRESYPGTPFQLYTITPSAVRNYQVGESVDSLLSETSMWYVPVMLGNKVKTLLLVDLINGHWEAVSLGYATLAREVASIQSQWPGSKGYAPRIISIFQAKEHFFNIPSKDQFNLTPIRTRQMPKVQGLYSDVHELHQEIERLKPIIEENMHQ